VKDNVIRIYGGRPSRFELSDKKGVALPTGLLVAIDEFADDFSAELGITLSRTQTVTLLLKEALYARGIDVVLNTHRKKRKKKIERWDCTYFEEFEE